MMRAVVLLAAITVACGGTDTAEEWRQPDMPFDPSLSPATLDFTDGTTTVDANFLENLVPILEIPSQALEAGLVNANVCQFVDDPSDSFADILVEVDAGGQLASNEWCAGGGKIFNLDDGTGFTIEVRELDTLELESPARTFTLSWAAGDINWMRANDKYLVVGGNDSGAGADKVDIFDLDTDTLVGTYTCTGNISGASVLGRTHVFVQTDTATASIYAVTLSTAVLDTSWGTSGVTALNYGVATFASIDDRFIVYSGTSTDDDVEFINHDDGSSDLTSAGLGTGTGNSYMFAVGNGDYVLWQNADGYLSRYTFTDNVLRQLWEIEIEADGTAYSAAAFDGHFIYASGLSHRLLAFDVRTGAQYDQAGPNVLNDAHIVSDGMRVYVTTSNSAGDTYDGIAALKGVESTRRLRRVDHGGRGKLPYSPMPLVPCDL